MKSLKTSLKWQRDNETKSKKISNTKVEFIHLLDSYDEENRNLLILTIPSNTMKIDCESGISCFLVRMT
ncbi:CLUMA_CG006793, isoform A [Clunio marinus]|uniref:CLUMA_CG006793, isoform A n=1 Tax=Clunio marinus TaxID=568069 RepID=A0A1J1I0E6_9DIPT|nr:CLUMA_CG006793, isoform A [Clunio marinus]